MVITDVPFDARERAKKSRYSLIRQPDSALPGALSEEEEEASRSKEYATFLKEQERKCGTDGFLDSQRFNHPYDVAEKQAKRAGTPRPNSQSEITKPLDSISVVLRSEQEKKDYEKRIKVIEDHMWQHKQEERELKRTEGDILKKRYAVRHTLRDYENTIQKDRLAVDQSFNKGMEKYTKLEQAHLHSKVDTIKERANLNEENLQQNKDQGRKIELQKTDLARKYRTTLDELELKQVEHNRLVSEFESKLRTKESEQFELKKKLADYAIKLNMEASKGREFKGKSHEETYKETAKRIRSDLETNRSLDKKLSKGDVNAKTAITEKRRLSADLTLQRAHLGLKNREEIRQLQDTRNELSQTAYQQRKLNEGAVQAELDLKTKLIDKKLKVHEARKTQLMHHALTSRKEKSELQEKAFAEKFQRRFADMAKREHEDHLKHFQRMVVKGEEEETRLYNKVREAEYARQKQEQQVKRLQLKQQQIKNKNSQEMKKRLTTIVSMEKEQEQKILREQGVLDKLHAEREESYEKLQKHREMLKRDQHNLEKHDKEHARLQKIAAKSNTVTDVYS
ncbi:calponin homology domain-containing protein DDB_G0272472-like [Watersipora subatra]|uniref:calponin homology domain-containing protein DDB_G0272472-like n=1 Tax=Watersipora subatra TaxID=2589382 RepID=UPI00355B94F3